MQLPYTKAESEAAHREWKAMCGHHSIAVACWKTLDQVRRSGVRLCGWMNPTMVSQCIGALGWGFHHVPVKEPHPYLAIYNGGQARRVMRIQFEGPWMKRAATEQYRHTHYIACVEGEIMDPVISTTETMSAEVWYSMVEDGTYAKALNVDGLHFTHDWRLCL